MRKHTYSISIPRPRIQRAFVRWFIENYTRFMVPVRLTKISGKGVEIHFQGYPDCLSAGLSRNELGVYVEWQGEGWDCLIDLEANPIHTRGGYQCKSCVNENDEQAMVFPSREALWKDHLFEPFLKWVNEQLAPACWLRISSIGDGGTTWAELILAENELSKPDRSFTGSGIVGWKYFEENVKLPQKQNVATG